MKKLLLILLLSLPLLFLILRIYSGEVEEPVNYIYLVTGYTAISLLFVTTSLSMIRERINLIKYRKIIGLASFFYALLHFLNFFIFDAEYDLEFVYEETVDKPFIYLGMGAFTILIFMAITSFKSLFRRFYKYHKVIYLAIILATIHFAMAQKAFGLFEWGFLIVLIFTALFKSRQIMQRDFHIK